MALMACACSGTSSSGSPAEGTVPVTTCESAKGFSRDSAYANVAAQVEMGPRVPGSEAHSRCAGWIASRLEAAGADTVAFMGSPAVTCDGTNVDVKNIFARFGTDKQRRILLMAHYDTRPWADHDPDLARRHEPIDGANDGASGVAVLLEVARQIGLLAPEIGVDFLFTDVEDYGSHADSPDVEDSWCIGARQFAENLPYPASGKPFMGVLLDMVGGRDAAFPMEYFSALYARNATAKMWAAAAKAGVGRRFPARTGGAITDDHLPLIRAGIPVADIIESAHPSTGSFNPTWHTTADNIDNIDPDVMADVGRAVLTLIYNEKP